MTMFGLRLCRLFKCNSNLVRSLRFGNRVSTSSIPCRLFTDSQKLPLFPEYSKEHFLVSKMINEAFPLAQAYLKKALRMITEISKPDFFPKDRMNVFQEMCMLDLVFREKAKLLEKRRDEILSEYHKIPDHGVDFEKEDFDFRVEFDMFEKRFFTIASVFQFYNAVRVVEKMNSKCLVYAKQAKDKIMCEKHPVLLKKNFEFFNKMIDLKNQISNIKDDCVDLEISYFNPEEKKRDVNFLNKIGPVKTLADKKFSEFLDSYWFIMYGDDVLRQNKHREVEEKLSRILEQRNIAIAKWSMRKDHLSLKHAQTLSQKEGITLGPIEFELDFELARNKDTLETLSQLQKKEEERDKTIKIDPQNPFTNEMLNLLVHTLTPKHSNPKSAPNTEDPSTLHSNIKQQIADNVDQKPSPDDLLASLRDEIQTMLTSKPNSTPTHIENVQNKDFEKNWLTFSSVRIGNGDSDKPEKSAVHYRKYYPEKNPPPREIPDTTFKFLEKKFISVCFVLETKNYEDSPMLRRFIENFFLTDSFQHLRLLKNVVDFRFLNNDVPFELTSFRWHQDVAEKSPDLYPWLSEAEKQLLGVVDSDRFKDDPVPLIEDDSFAEYWKDIALGLPLEESVRCNLHIRSSHRHCMQDCEKIILKHCRSVFCTYKKYPINRKRFTMLRSAHVHGDAKDHMEEVVFHHEFVLVVPKSQRFRVERASEEAIALGSDVTLSWYEKV